MFVIISLVVFIVSVSLGILGALLGARMLLPLYRQATVRPFVPRAMLADLFVLVAHIAIPLALYADIAPRRPNDSPTASVLVLVLSVTLLWALAVVTACQLGIIRTSQRLAFVGVVIPAAWFCIITAPMFVVAILYHWISKGVLPWWAVALPVEALVLWLCRSAVMWILSEVQSPHPQ